MTREFSISDAAIARSTSHGTAEYLAAAAVAGFDLKRPAESRFDAATRAWVFTQDDLPEEPNL